VREQIPRTIHQERSCAHRRLKHSNDYCRPLHDPWSTRHFWRRQEVSATFTFRRPGGFFHPSRNIPKFYHLAAVRGEWRTSVQFFVCCFLFNGWRGHEQQQVRTLGRRNSLQWRCSPLKTFLASLLRRKASISCASFFDASLPGPLGGLG